MESGNAFAAALEADTAGKDVEVWPENWQAFSLFCRVGTQWTSGMGGATGLRYEALYPLLDRAAEDPEHWDDLLEDIRILEAAALAAMNET